MNPRAAINDLTAFQAIPFNHLGTSPKKVEGTDICNFHNWIPATIYSPRQLPTKYHRPLRS